MLDFALHGWDLVDALGLSRPHLAGHSMGGMIAAEMACLAPRDLGKLALAAPAGLWMDEQPIPDIFAMLPYQLAEVLFHDPAKGQALLTGGADLSDMEALKEFYIGLAAPPVDGGQDPVSDSQPAAVQASVPAHRADARGVGRRRSVDRARLRRALEGDDSEARAWSRSRTPATCCRTSSRRRSSGRWAISWGDAKNARTVLACRTG